ncbi:putative ABC transport system permease protein [Bacillus ectoiniformans]|uniref:ABC transporter permease n=1 Tax=Bacillus ectoiniformans TaxID=1494429 RepID=UPI001959473E|nr:iron export ABC transporter permease subunit FetB [Bacillus ectoiniformans]MBM7650120.1 putative ABC transport system permease protein [Bacillus ectoiniformans]
MNLFTLMLALVFVLVAVILSNRLKLGLEKDMLIAAVRSTIQLLIVGYLLSFVFEADSYIFLLLMISLMITVASQNVVRRGEAKQGMFWRVGAVLLAVELMTMFFMLSLNIIPPTARYVIPISGMIIGSSMVISSLLLNRLASELRNRKQEVLVVLSLGGTPKQAVSLIVKDAVKASMIPTIDSAKTIGLVQLPGMMTGQIIAGADPVEAVRYQLLIVFSLLSAAAFTSIFLGFLTYPLYFNQYQQLVAETEKR